jgi:hypothetical protein
LFLKIKPHHRPTGPPLVGSFRRVCLNARNEGEGEMSPPPEVQGGTGQSSVSLKEASWFGPVALPKIMRFRKAAHHAESPAELPTGRQLVHRDGHIAGRGGYGME